MSFMGFGGGGGGGSSTGSILGAVGGIFSSLMGALGQDQLASYYKKAALLTENNAALTDISTGIQVTQADRKVLQTVGGQQADVASSGFASSGSALDLLRDSSEQGSLTKALIATQGHITAQGFLAQAQGLRAQASAARSGATSGYVNTGLKVISAAYDLEGGGGS